MNYVLSKINPYEFSDQNEINKEVKRCQERWLREPQEELNYKTPWEAILEERKRLGNPRKDFSILMNIAPINYRMHERDDLNNIKMSDVPLVKDLETFVNYFIENRVKVTVKNRWIPFKHLKLIEEKFINKDIFNFLGKEEKRGEEPYKRYIYFIDLLSRAARFIYLDKKGWIQVNVRHFTEFSEKSYGEKLFELFLTWVEKVNWTKIPIREYLTVFAKEYQNKFIDILYCIDEFEVNKKIEIEELVHKLYGAKIEKMESSEEVFDDLITVVDVVLLKYLKWLRVITTQEKELIPGIGIGRIKKFWITPKGRKLIDRLIRYYVKIGKIQ